MTEDTGSKARPERHGIGSFAPNVPLLTADDTTDRGPAGSLMQARAREPALRLADRPPAARDWRLWLGAGLAVAALALMGAAGRALAHARLAGPTRLPRAGCGWPRARGPGGRRRAPGRWPAGAAGSPREPRA